MCLIMKIISLYWIFVRHLFDSNVRDYLGLNPVNADILKSLKEQSGPNFWWLNNGITIIGTQAHIVGNAISIQNVQIVNPLAYLYQKTDDVLTELKPYVGSKTARFLKNYRQIIMFVTVSRLIGTFAFGEKQLINFDLSKYNKDEVQKSITDLKEVNPNCFNTVKKLSAAFYTACFNHIATKYGVTAIQAIQAKNRELWSGEIMLSAYSLTDNIIERVFNKLPQQPWPVKIHKHIANELQLSEMVVSNAIGYMIYTGRLNHQVYGFVFDKDGKLIAEGNHCGHTEEEARTKLNEQKDMYEKKFGIDAF